MSKFEDREKSFEKKFQIEEELEFKISSRSNKYLGEWASIQLNYNEEEKEKYIQDVIKSDLEESGKENIFCKIKKNFQAASMDISDQEIRDQMEKAMLRAKEDFK